MQNRTRTKGRKVPDRQNGRSPLNAGFDHYVDKQLHAMFDDVLAEPIPADLKRLIDKFETREESKSATREGSRRKRDG
jgi:hypothetical protein